MLKPFALSVKMLVKENNGHFLLIKRSKDSRIDPGKWDFPGGKIEPGEKFIDALLREVLEETGLQVTVEHVVGVTELELEKLRVAVLIFEGSTKACNVCLSKEHEEFAWVAPKDLQAWDLCEHFLSFAKNYKQSLENK